MIDWDALTQWVHRRMGHRVRGRHAINGFDVVCDCGRRWRDR